MALTRSGRGIGRRAGRRAQDQTEPEETCDLSTGDALIQKLMLVMGTMTSTFCIRAAIAYVFFRYSGEHHAEFAFPAWEGPVVLAQFYPICETGEASICSLSIFCHL